MDEQSWRRNERRVWGGEGGTGEAHAPHHQPTTSIPWSHRCGTRPQPLKTRAVSRLCEALRDGERLLRLQAHRYAHSHRRTEAPHPARAPTRSYACRRSLSPSPRPRNQWISPAVQPTGAVGRGRPAAATPENTGPCTRRCGAEPARQAALTCALGLRHLCALRAESCRKRRGGSTGLQGGVQPR
jgi:hypothetical protein